MKILLICAIILAILLLLALMVILVWFIKEELTVGKTEKKLLEKLASDYLEASKEKETETWVN